MATLTSVRLFLLLLLLVSVKFQAILSATDAQDEGVLLALKEQWENTPPSWQESSDPCGYPWDGVTCNTASKVTAIVLPTTGLKGQLVADIFGLKELTSLDLSFNKDLTGSLSPQLGQLIKLNTLILRGCGFIGSIPQELGNLTELLFLALDSNKFTGGIPASLGNLLKLRWLDLSDNQLTGPLPVSNGSSPGLDKLLQAQHFHLQKNQLSGPIPHQLFRPDMQLFHIILHENQLSGSIPSTIGLVRHLQVLRLDRNHLTGEVPSSNLSNLTLINEINLAYNQLTGPLPDFTGMNSLQSLDLSNNEFDASDFPDWISTLNSLMTLVIDNGSLNGVLPETLFSLPELQQVNLTNNNLSGKLDMGDSVGQRLQLVNLQHNKITSCTKRPSYNKTLILTDNPVCNISSQLSKTVDCQLAQSKPYSTSLGSCGSKKCPEKGQKPNPQSNRCECAYPYDGTLIFSASLSDLTNYTVFQILEKDMCAHLPLSAVLLQNLHFNIFDELQMDVSLFPSYGLYFSRSEVQKISFNLSSHYYLPPFNMGFGPYVFVADPYNFQVLEDGKSSMSKSLILGISIGGALLVVALVGVGMYAIRQKKRAGISTGLTKSFASSGNGSAGSVQLKGARWFSYDELKKCTNNFSSSNVIGSGGYGMVYRGVLSDGQLVAIKRAFQGSTQGVVEFKTEIELLSRVHHKNLVCLIGFCFEQAEQILVYEFLPNGSVKDSLLGKSGIHLDWRKRLQIALGSARGLVYLHELANPPIIHRDVKSNNILLDANLNAKVADFGVSKLVLDSAKSHVSTQIKGTMGYLDPEYYQLQQLTEKSDVYSFGVVMLELLTAKQPIEKGKNMVREVRTTLDKGNQDLCGLRELLDPAIGGSTTSLPGFAMYVELALQCAEDLASDRPTMGEVVNAIEKMLQNEGIATNSTVSASSTFTDFSNVKDGLP